MFTYVILDDLPPIPERFLPTVAEICAEAAANLDPSKRDELIDSKHTVQNSIVLTAQYRSRLLKVDGQEIPSTYSMRFSMGDEFNQWVNEHIYPPAISPGEWGLTVVAGAQDPGGSSHHGAHLDSSRNYVLMYLLDLGGSNVITSFYKEDNKPFYRMRLVDSDPLTIDDYSTLTEIDSACFPSNTWVLLNGRILHGVSNIETSRVAVQIGVERNIFFNDDIIKHNIKTKSPYQ